MSNNDFLNLISSPLMNLDHTYRYSGTKLVEKETLSQHIVDCIMMGLKMIDEINTISGFEALNPETYVMKAVYHDLEEVITGDIPRPLKYFNDDTLNSMKEVADIVAKDFFEKEFQSYEPYDWWRDAKEDKEGFILKIVDNLVVVNKVIKEVTLLHNNYMLRVAHEVCNYTKKLLQDVVESSHFEESHANDYIENILQGAIKSMEEILDEHKDIMDCLNIYGQSMIKEK